MRFFTFTKLAYFNKALQKTCQDKVKIIVIVRH